MRKRPFWPYRVYIVFNIHNKAGCFIYCNKYAKQPVFFVQAVRKKESDFMEQIYRRRREHSGTGNRQGDGKSERSYKRMVLQQAAMCVLLFTAALFVKMSPNEEVAFVRQSICYILTHQTDCGQIFDKTRQFFAEKILKNQSQPDDSDSLTALQLPVDTKVKSEFGMRVEPSNGKESFHYGVDFSGENGDKIKCVSDGVAEEVGVNEEYGNYIVIRHNEKYSSFYAHCEKILPVQGEKIKSGQVIATMGGSGNVTEPCLHFEIREGDTSLDPAAFLKLDKSQTQQ